MSQLDIYEALRRGDERVRLVTDALPIAISYLDDKQRYQFSNTAHEKMYGISSSCIAYSHISNVIGKSAYEKARPYIEAALSGKEVRFEYEDNSQEGKSDVFEVSYLPHFHSDRKVLGLYILSQNITSKKQAEQKLFEEKECAQVTLNSIGDAVITTDPSGIVKFVNPMAEKLTGWKTDEARDKPLQEIFNIYDETTKEPVENPVQECLKQDRIIRLKNHTILKSRNGKEFSIQDTAAPIRNQDGKIIGAVLVFKDVTESRRMAQEISYHTSHDVLTGLVNRSELERRLDRILKTVQNDSNAQHIFCYLDLDQFKIINDACGHMAGDELIRQLGSMLLDLVRKRDTVARLGGDEFALLMEHCTIEQAKKVADTIRKEIEEYRFYWSDKHFKIGVSIGVVPITSSNKSISSILSAADTACYAAKEQGRNRIKIYYDDDKILAKRSGEMQWVSRINQALEEGSFILDYQSIVPIKSSENPIPSFELLTRLKEKGKIISPEKFIPAAEHYNLSTKIDRWVVKTAADWFLQHPEYHDYSYLCTINLSGHSLVDADFFAFVISQFKNGNLRPETICFEITETAAIANISSARQFINELKALGCQFALDDFGSGFSSFAYLKTLPVDYLKIDGMFIKDIVDDQIACAMVKSINEIGQVMGMRTIAEWVENKEILLLLKEIGVDYVQGYGISKPEPLCKSPPKNINLNFH